jgi:predicted nucleic acid-binding protein
MVGISSYITLLEIMVRPLREGKTALALEYRDYLVSSRNFELFPVDRVIAQEGADIRATLNLKPPDAIQLATALTQRADVFLTNDIQLRRFNRVEVIVLDELLEAPAQDQ